MTQADVKMNAFHLACRNRVAADGGPSPNPPLNRTPGPRDTLADVVPPPLRDLKGE